MKTIREILRTRYTSTDIYGAVNDWIEALHRTIDSLPEGELSDNAKKLIMALLSSIRKDILLLEKIPNFSENAVTISLHFITVENALRTGVLHEKDELENYVGKFVFAPLGKLLRAYIDFEAVNA